MIGDDLKLFLHGLPPDCQENALKDFLEGVCDLPGAVTRVNIPSSKTYAFVTLGDTEVVNFLLRNTLLYCDGDGQFYKVKACCYVKQQFRRKQPKDPLPETEWKMKRSEVTDPKPVKYSPPEHVHQITPDYSMLLFSKQKRKKRKGDDSTVWFGGFGANSCRKRPKRKGKKKQVSKLVVHKSESFQFGSLHPVNTAHTTRAVEPVHGTGPESGKQEGNVPAGKNESFQCVGNLCPEHECTNVDVIYTTDNTNTVEPVVPGHGTGQDSGKQEGNVPAGENKSFQFVGNLCPGHECTNRNVMDTTGTTNVVEPVVPGHGTDQDSGRQEGNVPVEENESFQFVGNLCTEHKCTCSSASLIDTTDTSGIVEPVLMVHRTNPAESEQQEGNVPVVEVVQVEPTQSATKPLTTNSRQVQVIVDHSYLGPMCLQFTNPPSAFDVKNEIMERTGLPIKNQDLYCNGKKLSDSLSLRCFLDDNQDSLTLTLTSGSLKGGVRPKNETKEEGAIGGETDPSTSQEGVRPKNETKEEGAIGGETDPSTSQEGAIQSMDTWNVEKTASWLCQIGLDEKYAAICQKEDINGRALLLLARDVKQLLSVFQLKKGPQTILMKHLKPHSEISELDKSGTTCKSTKRMNEWTVKELCSWLTEIGIPKECVTETEEEEIDGQAFLLLFRESGDLQAFLKLKLGSWIVLQHELLLHERESENTESDPSSSISSTNPSFSKPNQIDESKEPLPASAPTSESASDTPPQPVLSKEEEKLLLLKNALQLDIELPRGSQERHPCSVRSIFVKRGKGANALEQLFNFIVITKDELTGDHPRKLWAKILEKVEFWMKLLPEKVFKAFQKVEEFGRFVYGPSGQEVYIRDDKVNQIFLDKLSDDEYKKSCFVVLIDKQLLHEKTMYFYRFSFDRKNKQSYDIKLSLKESKYHASFDVNSPSPDLKWSKYFRSLKITSSDSGAVATASSKGDEKPSLTHDTPHYPQTPRPFNSEFEKGYYNDGFVLNCWETGPKDMITPVHEFKLNLQNANSREDDNTKKFVYETLRFACACLNERTNGTIHFGIADEKEGQTCGYKPREIVGSSVISKPLYSEKLTEFIDKCFVGPSRSNVHSCIHPPVIIPVKGSVEPRDKVVIEVDIEPRHSLCEGEIFKVQFKGLDRGNENPAAYIRHGSETKQIIEMADMEDYLQNRRPRLDEERKKREGDVEKQDMENQESCRHLFVKLRRLVCANKKVLDRMVYPILVLSKPDASMNQEFLDKTFCFIQKMNLLTVIDFDDQGSDSNGLCKVFKSGPNTPQVDIHEAEDYDGDNNIVENISYKTHWIYGNGYAKLGKEAAGFIQWNNSERKRGLSKVIQSVEKIIPVARAVVMFLLLSKDYQAMADTFKDFCTFLNGPNQLVYVAENSEIVKGWEETLSKTCLEEHKLRERGVVGMSWSEFQECMQQMVCGTERDQRYVIKETGSFYPLGNASFNSIEIVSAKECEELTDLSSEKRSEQSSKDEKYFYRGYPVTWKNFWFTTVAQKNHVLLRDNYSDLRNLIEKLYSQETEETRKGRVQTITVYHHMGAGASTMTRQALWDFRCNPEFPYRCAVVTKIDDGTCKELLHLRKIGYGEESERRLPPVLALVDDTDDFLFRELRSQVVELASKLPRTDIPVCVFLYCKPTQKPRDCQLNEKATSVFLEQNLSQKEVDWFKDKYTEMKQKVHNKNPEQDFEKYANENLISFMIMKENYNPNYASSIVGRNLDFVKRDELTLLEYSSLLSIYNPYPVFASCFDTLMLSSSLLEKRIFRDWVEDLTHSARIFLREVDCSTHFGSGKAIAIVHPIIASELLDQIAARKQTSVSQIALDFLKSPLLQSKAKSFTSDHLLDGASRMLKHRKKYEYGDDVQTKFSPLIEKILYGTDGGEGKKEPTEQSIDEAADVLREGLDKFKDPGLAQQMARVFYVNAAAFCKSGRIDECFNKAFSFCNQAIEMNPNNSVLFDTMGRIYEGKMKVLYGPIREETRLIEIEKVTPILPHAFSAMKWFEKSLAASVDYENKYGFHGQLSVMFYLLDVFRCIGIFRGQSGLKRLQGYLAYCQVIPPEVQSPWSEFHESIRDLRNRYSDCMGGLAEDFTIFKGNSRKAKILPQQISQFKAQYLSYFGDGDEKWSAESPEERWEYRWQKINQYLAGDIFSSVFRIHRIETGEETPKQTLEFLRKSAHENYCEPINTDLYKDLLLFVTASMALHSPYGKRSKSKSTQLIQEYREIYKFVEQLFSLEECDEGYRRLYAHLLKVMFLWPRKDLELSDYLVQDFYDALKKLRTRWESKCKGHIDADKKLKQNVYKYMSFKKETRQYTTLFYLGKGTGLDVFVHINELAAQSRGSLDWEHPSTKERLKRLTGVVESKNTIKMKNPLDPSRAIDIYYSSFRQGGFSKEEVSFYLGFSWPQPIALDVKYTNAAHVRHSVELSDPVLDDQVQFSVPKYGVLSYQEYTSRMEKLMKKLSEIDSLKEKKERGVELDENQKRKINKEVDFKRQLHELKHSLDALGDLEEEIFD